MPKLTLKQRRFVKEFIDNDGNATQAAVDSGYNTKNRTVAKVIGAENLSKPAIREEIELQLADAGLTKPQIFDWLQQAIQAGVGEKATNADAIRAITEVIKLYDLYPAQRKQVQRVDISLQLGQKTDSELAEMVTKKLIEAQEFTDEEE